MARASFHPNAFLRGTRNVRQGLASRTKILRVLEGKAATAMAIAASSYLNYGVVLHHLKLLEGERIVSRGRSPKPFLWELTGLGQQRLAASKLASRQRGNGKEMRHI